LVQLIGDGAALRTGSQLLVTSRSAAAVEALNPLELPPLRPASAVQMLCLHACNSRGATL
jgi:hypothetical protein